MPYSYHAYVECLHCSGSIPNKPHKHWGAGLPTTRPVPKTTGRNSRGFYLSNIHVDPALDLKPTATCRNCWTTTPLSLPLPEKAELPVSKGRLVPQIKEYSSTWGIKGGHPQGKWPRQTIPDGIDEDELAYWRARADKAASTILRHHLHHSLHKKKKKIIKEYEALDKAALDLMSRGLSQKKTAEVFRTSDKHLKELSAGKAPWRFKPLEHQPSLSGDPPLEAQEKGTGREKAARSRNLGRTEDQGGIGAGSECPQVPKEVRRKSPQARRARGGTGPLEEKGPQAAVRLEREEVRQGVQEAVQGDDGHGAEQETDGRRGCQGVPDQQEHGYEDREGKLLALLVPVLALS